jgi:hypothetical protein
MPILHIEHPITEFTVWKSAFDRFADARASAGVIEHRISRPVDDDAYIVVDLTFAKHEEAEKFLTFLQTMVWARPEASPGLRGEPQTRILTEEETVAAPV